MPTIISVLPDTEVFLLSAVKYTAVNEGTICGETPTLYGTLYLQSNNPCTGTVRRDSPEGKPSLQRQLPVAVICNDAVIRCARYWVLLMPENQ